MSYLSEELQRQMTAHDVAGLQLAERTGISASQIYNWLNDRQSSITESQLSVIQAALGDDHHDHARLVLAHLLDEKFGLNHELVDVSVRSDSELRDAPRSRSKGERAMEFLAAERVRNRELNDMLIDLARLLGAEKKP